MNDYFLQMTALVGAENIKLIVALIIIIMIVWGILDFFLD